MAISLVQSATKVQDSNVASSNVTFGSDTTSNNNIVVYMGYWRAGGGTTTTVTDSKSNTYNSDQLGPVPSGDSGRSELASAENITGGASHQVTVTYGGSGVYGAWGASEVSGLKTSSAEDSSAGGTNSDNNPGSTDATVTGGASSAQANNIVFCVPYVEGGDTNLSFSSAPTTGYTAIWTENNAAAYGGVQPSYKIISASETSSATWSHDDSNGWSTALAVYQEAAAGGGGNGLLLLNQANSC